MSSNQRSHLGILFFVTTTLAISSCGRVELGGVSNTTKDRRSDRNGSEGSADAIQLSGHGSSKKIPVDQCNVDASQGHGDKDHKGYGNASCPAKPTPPPAPTPTPTPTPAPTPTPTPGKEPPLPAPTPSPSPGKGPLVEILTGLVCQRTPDSLFQLAQYVGSQSKDQLQYLVNAEVTGNLTIDMLVEYGKIAKSLTVDQLAAWKTRVCVTTTPVPPEEPKVVVQDPTGLEPPPVVDDAGKDQI